MNPLAMLTAPAGGGLTAPSSATSSATGGQTGPFTVSGSGIGGGQYGWVLWLGLAALVVIWLLRRQ